MPIGVGEIAAGIGAVKGAWEIGKSIAKVKGEFDKIEHKQLAVELMDKLMELLTENVSLKIELAELKEHLKVRGRMVHRGSVYFQTLEDGTEDGPFCTRCFDVDQRLVRIIGGGAGVPSHCPQCSLERSKGRK